MSAIISVFSYESILVQPGQESIWTTKVIVSTVIMLLSGTMNTLSFKLQNQQDFRHGMVQSMFTFIGEWLNMLILGLLVSTPGLQRSEYGGIVENVEKANIDGDNYLVTGRRDQPKKLQKRPDPPSTTMILPAFLDTFGSSLQVVALLLIPASINQMLRGGVIIFACLESKLFLGKQVFRHQILGIFICFLGFVMVGVASLIHKTDLTSKFSSAESGSAQTIMGLVMILISIIIQATQFVVEEKILETYEISPMRMVGVEGMFATGFCFVFTMVFTFMDCPAITMCDMTGSMENPIAAMREMAGNGILLFWCFVTIISIMLFNLFGVTLTKNVSAVFRAFWDATRTILIWIFSLLLGLEAFVPAVFGIQVVGFVFLLCGNFIYNEVLVISCFGFDKSLKKNMIRLPSKLKSKKRTKKGEGHLSQLSSGPGQLHSATYSVGNVSRLSDERYDSRPGFKENEISYS